MPSRLAPLALVGALMFSGSACSGEDEGPDVPPEQAMATAKEKLDETSGVTISLETTDLPDGVTGILTAQGVGTHAPAFEGSIKVAIPGGEPDVRVVAVDGLVHAVLPFTTEFQQIDPGEYGAPDPAELMTTDAGFSSLLPATTDLEAGDTERGGEDNKEIFTSYSGTVPGSVVKNIIPSSIGDFDASYTVSRSGELRSAELTGKFYKGEDTMTYTIEFDDYGTEKDITAP